MEEEQTLQTCTNCGEETERLIGTIVSGDDHELCQGCADDTFDCAHCGRNAWNDFSFSLGYRRPIICEPCYCDHYFTCSSCGGVYDNDDYGSDGLCHGCYESEDDEHSGQPATPTRTCATCGEPDVHLNLITEDFVCKCVVDVLTEQRVPVLVAA